MKAGGNFWLKKNGKSYLGKGRVELLKKIERLGSISKAAKEMNMSYKAAWDIIDILNRYSTYKVVEKTSGGKGGGGSRLTEYGKYLINLYEETEKKFNECLSDLEKHFNDKMLKFQKKVGNDINDR